MTNLPEYRVWCGMVARCHCTGASGFKRYGARGIAVCPEWRGPGGFERFIAYVGRRPTDRHSIDRYPNGKGNYEPGNVRWASPKEQAANRDMRKANATRALHASGHAVGQRQMGRLLREIRRELEETFGPPRNDFDPSGYTVEQAYWERDYSMTSGHFDGLENLIKDIRRVNRKAGRAHFGWRGKRAA